MAKSVDVTKAGTAANGKGVTLKAKNKVCLVLKCTFNYFKIKYTQQFLLIIREN